MFICYVSQFSSATSDDLWSALQAALDESNVPHNDYRLKEVMDTWLKQRHYPVVHVTRNNDTGETILTQEHFLPKNKTEHVDSDKWWIPLTFATQTNPDFSDTLPSHWLRPQDKNISIEGIDPNDWIIVNIQQMGYYRVNYDESNWRKLANYLNSDNYTKIHVINRAQIIDDAYHFMITNQLDIQIFLHLISYLSQESDFIALYPMFDLLQITEDLYKLPENENFRQYMLLIFDGLIKNVGYEEDRDEDDLTKLKRIDILKWACNFGHSECKKMANIKLNEFLANPKTHRPPPNLQEWTYCNGMMEANASTWNKFMDTYFIKQDQDVLEYLTCSENPDILINFLNKSALNDLIIQNDDYSVICSYIITKHSDNDVVLDYILTNLEEIVPREANIKGILFALIYSVHSHERLDKIKDFVKSKYEEEISEYVQSNIKHRKFELANFFASFDYVY